MPQSLIVQRALFDPEEGLPLTHGTAHATTHGAHASPAISSAPATGTVTRKSGVFETMVKLYYALKPQLLLFFVQLVSLLYERAVANSNSQRSSWGEEAHKRPEFLARALLALPPLPDGEILDAQLSCRFEVSFFFSFSFIFCSCVYCCFFIVRLVTQLYKRT